MYFLDKWGGRHTFVVMAFFCFVVQWSLKNCLNVTIVAMVNQQQEQEPQQQPQQQQQQQELNGNEASFTLAKSFHDYMF
jgi:hypothetical protein